jgi:excinuclease UvrABC nuclease subunit
MKKEKINLNSGVYLIKTNSNKILYIGASINLEKRLSEHSSLLKKNNHDNISLQNICNKIGYDNLIFSVLKYGNSDLFYYEELFIKTLSPLCNVVHNVKIKNKIKNKNTSTFYIDIEFISNMNLEFNKRYINYDLKIDTSVREFYRKLKLYCDEYGYKLVKGNTNGNRYFIIKTNSNTIS